MLFSFSAYFYTNLQCFQYQHTNSEIYFYFSHIDANFFDILFFQILPIELVRLVMRELAKFHASSQGVDWLKLMPEYFEQDISLEVGGGQAFKGFIRGGIVNSVIPIMEHIDQNNLKYTDFLRKFDENVMPVLLKLFKSNSRYES
jgi:hypothetical protein